MTHQQKFISLCRLDIVDRATAAISIVLIFSFVYLYSLLGVLNLTLNDLTVLPTMAFGLLFATWLARQDVNRLSSNDILRVVGVHWNSHIIAYTGLAIIVGVVLALIPICYEEWVKPLKLAIPGHIPPHENTEDIMSIIIHAPIIEEVFFRHISFGVLIYALSRLKVSPQIAFYGALVFSSAAFGISHDWKTPLGWAFTSALGCAMAYLYHRSGQSLYAPIAGHASHNGFLLAL